MSTLTINGKPPELRIVSLADLKRAVAIPGIAITATEHWIEHMRGAVRTPKQTRKNGKSGIQTNGYYFDAPDRDGKIIESWAPIPGRSQLAFHGDNTVTFHPDTPRSWTLRFDLTEPLRS